MSGYQNILDQNGITQEYVKEVFGYDEQKGILIRKKHPRWGTNYNRPVGIVPSSHGYGRVFIGDIECSAHQVIWLWVYGTYAAEIDHIDNDRMNNRISNLREASRLENMHNKTMYSNNTSSFPGVGWHSRDKVWAARIQVGGKRIHLGYFDDINDAITAYMLGKIEHHPTSPQAEQFRRELLLAG